MPSMHFLTYCTPDYLFYAINSASIALRFHEHATATIVCTAKVDSDFCAMVKLELNISILELVDFPESHGIYNFVLKTRTPFESLITIKPSLLQEFIKIHLFNNQILVYIDTDIGFYGSLKETARLLEVADFVVFEHAYSSKPKVYPYGKFNAGLVLVKHSKQSLEILREWSNLCVNWCELKIDRGNYADQGYLEKLVLMPGGVGIYSSQINVGMHLLVKNKNVKLKAGMVLIDSHPVIAFHFHGMKIVGKFLLTGLNRYGFQMRNLIIYSLIHKSYFNNLKTIYSMFDRYIEDSNLKHDTSSFGSKIQLIKRLLNKGYIYFRPKVNIN